MTASAEIKTPMMKLPLKGGATQHEAEALVKGLNKLVLTQILENISIEEKMIGNVGFLLTSGNYSKKQAIQNYFEILAAQSL